MGEVSVVVFRVDSSIDIGTGHVMRCLTLADEISERGSKCIFICRPHKGHLLPLISQRGHCALALPELQVAGEPSQSGNGYANWLGTDWLTDAHDTQQMLSQYIEGQSVDWLVVDHYALDARWEKLLRLQAKRIMVIDDLADRPHDCDILLDQNLGRTEADYSGLLKFSDTVLIGSKYALLRPDFARLRQQSLLRRRNNLQLRHLLISMGGVDKNNATGKVLAALQSCFLPVDLQLTVVMGPQAPWIADVKSQALDMHCYTEVLVGVDNMAQLMANSDLAIGAAGATSWERCCLGIPTITYTLASNQAINSRILVELNASIDIGNLDQLNPDMHCQLLAAALNQFQVVARKMAMASANLCDGRGSERVVEFLLGESI